MTTVTAVKSALEEFGAMPGMRYGHSATDAAKLLAQTPVAVAVIANRLSDRGEAGNAATRDNLARLSALADDLTRDGRSDDVCALDWAIDQLTPPVSA